MKKLTSFLVLVAVAFTTNIAFADDVLVGEKIKVDGQTEVITDVKRRKNGDIKTVETVNTETGEKIKTKIKKNGKVKTK